MNWKNLINKYEITEEDIDRTINQLCEGGIINCFNMRVAVALMDLLMNGDIAQNS